MSEDPNTTNKNLPFIRLPDYKSVFANHLRMRVTPTEFTLFFGIVDEIQPNITVANESVATVMTPSVAKSLAEVLTQTIAVYEEQHGPIKAPSNQPLDAVKMAAVMQKQKERLEGKV